MSQLEKLSDVSEHVLSGLKADSQLKHRILLSAAKASEKTGIRKGAVIALCSLSLVVILLCAWITSASIIPSQSPELQVIPAGGRRNSSPVSLQQIIEKASEVTPEAAKNAFESEQK